MKIKVLSTLLVVILGLTTHNLNAQNRGEIKLDVYDMIFALVGVSYEYPLGNNYGIEFKAGYDFYVPRSIYTGMGDNLETFTSHEAIAKLALRRYFSTENTFKGFGLGIYSEIQWETYFSEKYRIRYKDRFGVEDELEQPRYLFIGSQLLYKHVYPSNFLLEFNLEPGLDLLSWIEERVWGLNLNFEIKLGYRFGESGTK